MKDSTKKILLATGGVVSGVVLASVGGGFLGLAIGGVMVRTGLAKAAPTASKEFITAVTQASSIAKNAVVGAICTTTGISMSTRNGGKLGYEIAKMREEKVSIVAPPPSMEIHS